MGEPCESGLPFGVLLDVMHHQRYGVEYQPIVELATGAVFAYEALARFYDARGRSLPPDRFFRKLHESPLSLFEVEHRLKELQVQGAPDGSPLFINVDQDAFAAYEDMASNPLLAVFGAREELVVEITENTSVSDARMSLDMVSAFRSRNVRIALDDIGNSDSLLSTDVLLQVDYLKLDRGWLARLGDSRVRGLLRLLIEFAAETGKQVVVEGIETREHLQTARQLGAAYGQGFLFRDLFLSFGNRTK